ncbi:uncharacterized protein LOC135812625 [Sycon ciliatum]|uniref:uncharacterized protein LOC135812625 n=1 Tax=Sycon ciliatum TaxID=27933 RepID=UPI0031F661F9
MASLGNLFITLVVGFAAISSVNGQVLFLAASGLGISTAFTTYYLTGQSTSQIGTLYLPYCLARQATGSLIQLTNTNTGVVVGEHTQPFDQSGTADSTIVGWDTTQHSTLNSSYTGLYSCTSDVTGWMTARQTYQLHVVVPPTTPVLETPVSVYNDTLYNINCTGQGYPAPTVTLMVNNVVMTGTATSNCTAGVCTNTRTVSLDGSTYTPGQSINIACTVDINQPPFTCTGPKNSTLQAQCNNTAKTSAHTTTVPVVATHCPAVGNTTTTNSIPRLAVGTSRYVACNTGYSSGKTGHNTSCVSNGTLTHQPDCKDIDECNTMCNGSSSQCNNTLGSFLCTCDPGFTGDGFNCTDASTLEESNLAPALNESATSTLAPTLNQSATSTLNQSATSTLNQSATSMLAPALNQSATSTVALLSDGGADPTSSVPDIGETPAQSDSVMSTGSTTTFNSTLDIPNGKSSLTGGQVAGLVIGTLLLVALIGGIVFTLVKKQSPGSGKHISMTEMNA